jgi:hypothetical protein
VVRIPGTLIAATANPHAATRRVEDADRKLDGRNARPPSSTGFRLTAVVACDRAGHRDQARCRLQAAERIAGMWPAARGTPPSGKHTACCGKPRATPQERRHSTTRPQTSSPNSDAPSTATGAAPQLSKQQSPGACGVHTHVTVCDRNVGQGCGCHADRSSRL